MRVCRVTDDPSFDASDYFEGKGYYKAGSLNSEYQIYLSCADDGTGIDSTNGKPLKTYDEWLNN